MIERMFANEPDGTVDEIHARSEKFGWQSTAGGRNCGRRLGDRSTSPARPPQMDASRSRPVGSKAGLLAEAGRHERARRGRDRHDLIAGVVELVAALQRAPATAIDLSERDVGEAVGIGVTGAASTVP